MDTLTVCPIAIPVNVEYPHSTLVSHPLLRDADNLVVILAECNSLYSCREFPSEQTLSRLHRPET